MIQYYLLLIIFNYLIIFYSRHLIDVDTMIFIFILININTIMILFSFNQNSNNEHYSNEAIENVASLYNNKNMVVENLTVTGKTTLDNLTVTNKATLGSAKIGEWEMRADKLGIPNRADISNDADNWIRIYDYNTNSYGTRGVATASLWENGNMLSDKYVRRDKLYRLTNSRGGNMELGICEYEARATCDGSINPISIWKPSGRGLPVSFIEQ